MIRSTIHYSTFPRTELPPAFVASIVDVFRQFESQIAIAERATGFESNRVLMTLRDGLVALGFSVEGGKSKQDKIARPVFFGENGMPTLQYQIDAFHSEWKCGLEIEAARALKGNAIYRDLVQALVMIQVEYLVLAVPNRYRYQLKGRTVISQDYVSAVSVADTLFGHTRFRFPYRLAVIGY